MNQFDDFDKLLATLEQEMAQVQASQELHLSFRDGRNLITVCEPDPEFKEMIVEYYRHRIESMQRWRGEAVQPGVGIWHLPATPQGIDPTMLGYQ